RRSEYVRFDIVVSHEWPAPWPPTLDNPPSTRRSAMPITIGTFGALRRIRLRRQDCAALHSPAPVLPTPRAAWLFLHTSFGVGGLATASMVILSLRWGVGW